MQFRWNNGIFLSGSWHETNPQKTAKGINTAAEGQSACLEPFTSNIFSHGGRKQGMHPLYELSVARRFLPNRRPGLWKPRSCGGDRAQERAVRLRIMLLVAVSRAQQPQPGGCPRLFSRDSGTKRRPHQHCFTQNRSPHKRLKNWGGI